MSKKKASDAIIQCPKCCEFIPLPILDYAVSMCTCGMVAEATITWKDSFAEKEEQANDRQD